MKKRIWNEGLNQIDFDLVEEFVQKSEQIEKQKRSNGIWLRLSALAACIALIVSAFFVVPMLWQGPTELVNPDPFDVSNRPAIPILKVLPPSSSPMYYGSEGSVDSVGGVNNLIRIVGMSVTATWVETLPDTYTFFDDWEQSEFRLIKMKTVTTLKGSKMVDEFYYIIPVDYMTDFSVFDKFVIEDMSQLGYEYSILYNKTQDCAEHIDLVLFGYRFSGADYMGSQMMVFDSNGNFDERLWTSTDEWKSSTEYALKENTIETIEQAEEAARPTKPDVNAETPYVHSLKSLTGEAVDVLLQISSLENGVYVPLHYNKLSQDPEVQLRAVRYISGFPTNETICIDSEYYSYPGSISFTKAHFTEDDLNALPDLKSAVAAVSDSFYAGEIPPPHIQNYEQLYLNSHGIFGWYAKTDNGIVGIIRITWNYREKIGSGDRSLDDMYYVIEYGSNECKPINRNDLLERIGDYETTYIYTGEYDETGKTPLMLNICL